MEQDKDKINVEDLIKKYKIMELGSLRSYLKEVYIVNWKITLISGPKHAKW